MCSPLHFITKMHKGRLDSHRQHSKAHPGIKAEHVFGLQTGVHKSLSSEGLSGPKTPEPSMLY